MLVRAGECLRGVLAPRLPHMNLLVLGALVAIDVLLLAGGLKKFASKAVS